MSFFNKKEEVLQIKLTQYGKHLLSKGKFNPSHYAFFDDTVIYDSEWALYEEHQNETEGRIQEDTPSMKVQHIFSGAETNIKKLTSNPAIALKYWEADLPYPQHTEDRHYSSTASPLGKSTPGAQKAPAFLLNFMIGEMTGSSYYLTGSHQTLKIPQLDIDLIYETSFSYDSAAPTLSMLRGPGGLELGGTFPDSSRLNVTEKHLLIEIIESNVEFSNDNFDIEVFEMEEEEVNNFKTPGIEHPQKKFHLRPLTFVKPQQQILNNLLLDVMEEEDLLNLDLDSNYIEHYLDVAVDGDIDTNIMCSVITSDKAEEMFDEIGFECPDKTDSTDFQETSPVDSTVPEPCDDMEGCD